MNELCPLKKHHTAEIIFLLKMLFCIDSDLSIQASHPIDICYQGSLFRRVNPLVVGPHTTLDGEQQHLEVSFLLEPETLNITSTAATAYIQFIYYIYK